MKWLALLAILLLVPSVLAASVTVDIYGTNVSNAQDNLTHSGNNSYQVVQWAVGDTTKSIKADINGNASDDITFTLHNFTAYRVVEVKVNSSSYGSYQVASNGTIIFTRTQTVRNQTYSFTPAVNSGGYNFTWFQLWTWPSLFGVNFTQYFLPYSGATADLNMNGKNITNVLTVQSTTVNITTLNATNVQGNGSGLYSLNMSNGTIGVAPNSSLALSALNRSENHVTSGNTSNISVSCQANGSCAIDTTNGIISSSGSSGGKMYNATNGKSSNTVYQNTNATMETHLVSGTATGNQVACIYVDTVTPPVQIATCDYWKDNATAPEQKSPITFVVPANYYYAVNGSSLTLFRWQIFV